MNTIETAYNNFCIVKFPLPSETDIASLESNVKVILPGYYKKYLLTYNGGIYNEPTIDLECIQMPSERLIYMHGINATNPIAELATRNELNNWDDNDPPQIVPIGVTMRNNYILIVTRKGDDYGDILYKTPSETYLLAQSMEDFFRLLCSKDSHP